MVPDDISLYNINIVRRWHNEWLGYERERCEWIVGQGVPLPTRPSIPFSLSECERELLRRYELGLEEA